MWSLTLGFVFITMVAFAYQEPIESLQHVLVYPMEPGTKKTKREVSAVRTRVDFNKFVEEKLIQHTQALEHLVKLAQQNEETIKQLVAILSRDFEKPKLPEKLEVHNKTRRSSINSDPPIVRFGRNVPKYGMLFKDLILSEMRSDDEPLAVAEHDISSSKSESRRSFGSRPLIVPQVQNEDQPSPWCSVAILCRRSIDPVCGYDDNFGYGKFDDICHMLQVNCYWKYNFALVPSCKPVL
ncbi:uncharacterized protein LOC120633805 isoform X1 [Pararge aegeria]|uniref:uncharacterized protein LOC120633805 isoform X1 n=1 Tax=Pararge aegeria TaxID=116150 RepID=UPI0019D0C6D8|nr:uncharacterized protein LOC120633805 isoform X1 [Pararge aegeria]